VPENVDALTGNLAMNGYTWVDPLRVAVSDAPGTVSLGLDEAQLVGASTADFSVGGGLSSVDAPAVTLDDVLGDGGRVRLLKIDAEGHERQIWTGMQETLARNPNVTVLMEFNPRDVTDPEQFLVAIQQAGFRLASVGHDGQIRTNTLSEALVPDTGPFRMLWLSRGSQ